MTGGILTVGFTFFFGTRNLPAQMLMTGILALIVFMRLFVILSIDHPFTGPVHIHGAALEAVLEHFAQAGSWTAAAGAPASGTACSLTIVSTS